MTIHLYARFGHRLYKVDTNSQGGKFTLRPTNGKPYQFIRATAVQLRNRSLFRLFPVFQVVHS